MPRTCAFEALPPEIKQAIMMEIDEVDVLSALASTCRSFRSMIEAVKHIPGVVLANQVGPELLKAAVMATEAASVDIYNPEDLGDFFERHPMRPGTYMCSLRDARRVANLHKAVACLAPDFIEEEIKALDDVPEELAEFTGPLTATELTRFYHAFYFHEYLTQIFTIPPSASRRHEYNPLVFWKAWGKLGEVETMQASWAQQHLRKKLMGLLAEHKSVIRVNGSPEMLTRLCSARVGLTRLHDTIDTIQKSEPGSGKVELRLPALEPRDASYDNRDASAYSPSRDCKIAREPFYPVDYGRALDVWWFGIWKATYVGTGPSHPVRVSFSPDWLSTFWDEWRVEGLSKGELPRFTEHGLPIAAQDSQEV